MTVGLRQVLSGAGVDTTTTVLQYLQNGRPIYLATLYLIGEPEDPNAAWLTDWDTPLTWSWWGTFKPAVIKRGSVASKIGLEVQTLDVEWSTSAIGGQTLLNFYWKTIVGGFDGATFRSWSAYMPSPGDCDSLGASELFGGRIGPMSAESGTIKFTVNSFLDVINQMVPGAVIESTNIAAGYSGAMPPAGAGSVPTFTVSSSSNSQVVASGGSFSLNAFVDGFIYVTSGSLAGFAAAIHANSATSGGLTTFDVGLLPSPLSPGDTFYASANAGNIITGTGLYPFPYVPAPEQAV